MTLLVLCIAALVGIAAAVLRPLDAGQWSVAAGLSVLAVALAFHAPRTRLLAFSLLAATGGALRVVLWPAPVADALEPFLGRDVLLHGEIHSAPVVRGKALSFRLLVDAAALAPPSGPASHATADPPTALPEGTDGTPQDGPPRLGAEARVEVVVLADDPMAADLVVGDRVAVVGRLSAPSAPAGFNRAAQLRRERVFSQVAFPRRIDVLAGGGVQASTLGASLRASAIRGIQAALPEPQASLTAGMLLGGSGRLSPAFRHDLQSSGLAHLMAIDGFKQVIVAGGLTLLATRLLGRQRGLPLVLLGIAGYTMLTGASASAVRAGLMVGMALTAAVVGRIADPLTGLALAATLMSLAEPLVLLDIGFQLSYSAVLGLILLYPRMRLAFQHLPRWVADPAGLTVAVTVATLPVTLSVFREVSLISPIAHVVAAPLIAPLMISAAALAVSLAVPVAPLTAAAAWAAWVPATLLAETIRFFGGLPGASVFTGGLPPWAGAAMAALLLAWCLVELPEAAGMRDGLLRLADHRFWPVRRSVALVGASVAACLLLVAWRAPIRSDHLLHVHVLAAGRGQTALVRGPDGTTVLLSTAGIDARGLATLVGDALNVWEREIDVLVVQDETHLPWLAETLRRYAARRVVSAADEPRIALGDGAVVDVFAAADEPGVAVSYGSVWVRLSGTPPAPGVGAVVALADTLPPPPQHPAPALRLGAASSREAATLVLPPPRESALELQSDGVSIWPLEDH